MGVKHRYGVANAAHTDHSNGSRCFRTADEYQSVAKVENCPCEDGCRRTAHATAEADSFFSIPACIYVGKKTVGGFLSSSEEGWKFTANPSGRNAGLLKTEE